MTFIIRALILASMINAALSGCGQKGPLFLPEHEPVEQKEKD